MTFTNLLLIVQVIYLIGNKCDLEAQRDVTYDEAKLFAEENGLMFIEASAKTGANVEEAFLETAKKIYQNIQDGSLDLNAAESGVQVKLTIHSFDDHQQYCVQLAQANDWRWRTAPTWRGHGIEARLLLLRLLCAEDPVSTSTRFMCQQSRVVSMRNVGI